MEEKTRNEMMSDLVYKQETLFLKLEQCAASMDRKKLNKVYMEYLRTLNECILCLELDPGLGGQLPKIIINGIRHYKH